LRTAGRNTDEVENEIAKYDAIGVIELSWSDRPKVVD
jgi:hypothetical protein